MLLKQIIRARAMIVDTSLQARLRKAIRRWKVRRRQFEGGLEILNELYEMPDPWRLSSDREQARFAATNRRIEEHLPEISSVLEIGCGEGLQTRFLMDVAEEVTGLEGAARAIARARILLPSVDFIEADFDEDVPSLEGRRFSLVTMCEMLCYLKAPAAAVRRAQAHADLVLVTMYEPLARPLKPILSGPQWRNLPPIVADGRTWLVYLWTHPLQQASPGTEGRLGHARRRRPF